MLKTTTPKFIFSITILFAAIASTKTMNDPLREFSKLCFLQGIKESDLQNIKITSGEKTESYSLVLSDGDILSANYSQTTGQIYCSRIHFDPHLNATKRAIHSQYFYLLKNIAENKQRLTEQEKKDL